MPSIGEVALFASSATGGFAVELAEVTTVSQALQLDGVEVVMIRGSSVLVVRNLASATYDDALVRGAEIANRTLDLLAIGGGQRLVMRPLDDYHLAWWRDANGKCTLRWHDAADLTMSGSVTAEVRDANGELVPQTAPLVPAWHESMRYFRSAQTTDDLFDAFRNIYLALESVLSSIEPVRVRANGRPEGERDWVTRALATASALVDLNVYLTVPVSDPATAVLDELYGSVRTSIFHAKNGRPVLLPQDAAHRSVVADALERYTRLYLDLCSGQLGVRFGGGGMTEAGFAAMIGAPMANLMIRVTSDATPAGKSDARLSPTGAPTFALNAGLRPDLAASMYAVTFGEAAAADVVSAIGVVRRAGAMDEEDQLVNIAHMEQDLDLSGFDTFECVLAVRGINAGMPRAKFAT